jgi:ESCRT-II complex subunit VPS36
VKDLESLMRKAKEMIQLAQSINSQLLLSNSTTSTSPSTTAEAEAASKLATKSLSSLGILSTVAVTSDQTRSEKDFHHSLARELSSLLQPPNTRGGGGGGRGGRGGLIEKRGGVIGLDELWCVWNRARGVSLVSPKNFKNSVQFLNLYTRDPILKLLNFPKSGLTVLISPQYDPRNFKNRLLGYIDEKRKTTNTATKARRRGITGVEEDKKEEEEEEEQTEGGIGLLEIAKLESLSLGLTKEMIELIELEQPTGASGEKVYGDGIVRDAGPGGGGGGGGGGEGESQGVRWFRDYITGFEWDGQD